MKKQDTGIFNYNIANLYADAGKALINPDFFVFTVAEVEKHEHKLRPSRSDHFAFVLVLQGEVKMKLNLISYTLTANSIFIVPPFSVNEVIEDTKDVDITVMVFSNDFMSATDLPKKHVDAFSFLAAQNKPPLMLLEEEKETLHSLMLLLKKKNTEGSKHPFINELLHYGFSMFMLELAAVYQREQPSANIKLTRKEDLIMSFIKMLTLHFKEERSVRYYADALFITPKHLTKTVKEFTGRTCGEFIDEMVITEAKILLNDLSLSIGNVADELHFSDQFFFSKFFKQHTGLSPSEYKNSSLALVNISQ